jgi:hypothetical protein
MSEFLSKFTGGGELIGLVAVAGGLLCGILCGTTAIVMSHWHKLRQLALKQDMLNRGMSVDEICAVLDAGTDEGRKKQHGSEGCRG